MGQQWKVLIADDEPIIREGIRAAMNWDDLHMVVVAEAEDGEEALEQAIAHTIDILLVDLNMPIMNGITCIKLIKEQLPDCKIIIITGHDEFTYAQEAIRLHVDDYILKPANPEQLRKVLDHVRRGLETTVKQNEHLKLASKQITKNYPLLRERFCLEWIDGHMTEEEIVEQLQFLQLPVICPNQFGVLRWPEFTANQALMKESDRQLLLFAIENIVTEWLHALPMVMFRDHSGLIVVCLWGDPPEEVWTEIEKSIQLYLKISIHLHFEPIEGGLMDIAAVYRNCKAKVYKDSQLSPMVRRARQLIRDSYADPDMTLETMAQSLQVSAVYLSRMMKQELGTSFVSLITNMRMNKAIQLLNSTELPIHDIAERVGYDTQHYFSTAFKKNVGVSPNQYRKGASFQEELPTN